MGGWGGGSPGARDWAVAAVFACKTENWAVRTRHRSAIEMVWREPGKDLWSEVEPVLVVVESWKQVARQGQHCWLQNQKLMCTGVVLA